MDCLNPRLEYTRKGAIYPLVLGYLAQLHGFIELSSRGFFLAAAGLSEPHRQEFLADLPTENVDPARRVLEGSLTGLLGDPSPASLVGPPVKVDTAKLAHIVLSESEPAIRHFNLQSAGSLLVLAWEHTEDLHTTDPLWEFLRHLRNAVAHGGHFHFLGKEPSRTAAWRGKIIERPLQDTPVFEAPVASGFLGAGDVLHLLADIDARFIR